MIHLGDITKIDGRNVPVTDVVCGGSPCQDLSIAGLRKGLAGERSGLYMEQIRIIKEMRENDRLSGRSGEFIRPRYMVWENVFGAFSSNKGKDFAAVIEEAIRIAEPEAPAVPVPEKGWPSAGCFYDEMGNWSIAWRVHDAQFWGVPQRRKRISLVADFGGLSAPEILFERKGLHWNPDESVQERKCSSGDIKNSTATTIGSKKIANTVTTITCCSYREDCETFAIDIYDARGNGDGRVVPTITGDHENRITDYTALAVERGSSSWDGSQISSTLTASNAGGSQHMPDKENFNHVIVPVDSHLTIRRLTPLECERLQGYPDGWTDIGEWTDSNGKKRKTSDSARYKALGNSIALPFWQWLMKRISAQYERTATMASLFDGIGGFPLCWERINGKGTALWASEIEEFPIAVTKLRFGGKDEENAS